MSKPITTKDLIKKLQELDPEGNMPVVRRGYFGEANYYEFYNISVSDVHGVPDNKGWRDMNPKAEKMITIEPPEIGEQPD